MEHERIGAFVVAIGLSSGDTPRGASSKSATIADQTHQSITNDGDLEFPWLDPAIQRALLGALVVFVCDQEIITSLPLILES